MVGSKRAFVTRRRVCTVLHMVNSVIYMAVIGWQEVIIININGSLLGGGWYVYFSQHELVVIGSSQGRQWWREGVDNLRKC